MSHVVELEIPARPEFVSIARMAVAALAGVRPGLPYDRVDELRIVVSEACTSAIESAAGNDARVVLRCVDDPDRLEVCIAASTGTFDPAVAEGPRRGEDFRLSLIKALVDEAEVRPTPTGSELRLVVRRDRGDYGRDG